MVNSWKKEQDNGLQANRYYELISCVLVNLKRANYSESTPISNEPLRLTRTHHEAAVLPPTPTLRCHQAAATATVTYVLIVVIIAVIVTVIVAVAATTFS
jgi:hypothetical protein